MNQHSPLTLDDLRDNLRRAETELECADMIDSQAMRMREKAHWRGRVERLREQIARIEEAA